MRVITGSAKGIRLKTPEGLHTRPTAERVKEALFSAIQGDLPGARVLDLFGGTGQLGIEALSRGAKHAVFIDNDRRACELIQENLRRTRMEQQGRVVRADYLDYLSSTSEVFDLVFLDPPYAEVFLESAIKRISEIDILSTCGIIITERPMEKELNREFGDLRCVREYKYGKTKIAVFRKAMETAE